MSLKLGNYTGFYAPANRAIQFKIVKDYDDDHYDIKTKDLAYSYVTLQEVELSRIEYKSPLTKEEESLVNIKNLGE